MDEYTYVCMAHSSTYNESHELYISNVVKLEYITSLLCDIHNEIRNDAHSPRTLSVAQDDCTPDRRYIISYHIISLENEFHGRCVTRFQLKNDSGSFVAGFQFRSAA